MNKDLITAVKMFNLGSPHFILAISKHIYPKICTKGDIIIRNGEVAEEFYMIK